MTEIEGDTRCHRGREYR